MQHATLLRHISTSAGSLFQLANISEYTTLRDYRVSQALCLGDTDITSSIEKETRIGMKLRILGSLSLKPKKITTPGTQQRIAPTNMTACINAQVITYAIH